MLLIRAISFSTGLFGGIDAFHKTAVSHILQCQRSVGLRERNFTTLADALALCFAETVVDGSARRPRHLRASSSKSQRERKVSCRTSRTSDPSSLQLFAAETGMPNTMATVASCTSRYSPVFRESISTDPLI